MLRSILKVIAAMVGLYVITFTMLLFYLFVMSFFRSAYASSTYGETVGPIKDTLYIQTGAKAFVDELNDGLQREANRRGLSKPIATVGWGYRSYKNKSLEFINIRNPLLDETRHSLFVNRDKVVLTTYWRF